MNEPRNRGRVAYLDGIRGVAIACVLGVHLVQRVSPLGSGGYIGVDIFFVLSGFVITSILIRSPRSYRNFITGRVKRLYPVLIAVAVILPILVLITPGTPVSTSNTVLAAGLSLVQATSIWLAGGQEGLGALGTTWSLAIEWYFYLLWPLAVAFVARKRLPARLVATTCAAAGALLWLSTALLANDDWFYYGPTARFGSLLAGCALSYYLVSKPTIRLSATFVSTITAGALVIITAYAAVGPTYTSTAYRWIGYPAIAVLSVIIIFAGQQRPEAAAIRFLGWWPIAGLGVVSYSLYLWHLGPIRLLDDGALGIGSDLVRAGIALMITVVATAVSYVFLERPKQRSARGSLTMTTQEKDDVPT